MTLEERIKFLKNFFVGTFPLPFPFYLSPLIPKPLLERLTEGERRSSSIFPWNPVAIRRSGRVRGFSLKKWMKRDYFANSPKILRRSLISKE
jgi:hypothetical protein